MENVMMCEDFKKKIEVYKSIVDEIVQNARDLEITSVESAEDAINFACKARDVCETIEDARKSTTQKARDFTSEVNSFAKTFTEPLKQVAEIISQKLSSFKAKKAEDDLIAQISGDTNLPVFDDLTRIRAVKGSSIEKNVWTYEVVDISVVPKQFLTVDDSAVKQAMADGSRNIPGLRIKCEQKTIIRRQ